MRRDFAFHLIIAFNMLLLLLTQQVFSKEPPDGVLVLKPGGYVFADYPGIFDAYNDKGITIEGWFYLTDTPLNYEDRWILIEKPGSYAINIRGKRSSPPIEDEPEGTIHIEYCIYGFGLYGNGWHPDQDPPINRWVHFAYQIKGTGPVSNSVFFDGMLMTTGWGDGGPFLNLPDPLFIGGKNGFNSMKGWIDEIRITKGWRYDTNKKTINPPRRFLIEEDILALWHFDEGSGSCCYADASGHNRILITGGTLPVNQEHELSTTWGNIKKSSNSE